MDGAVGEVIHTARSVCKMVVWEGGRTPGEGGFFVLAVVLYVCQFSVKLWQGLMLHQEKNGRMELAGGYPFTRENSSMRSTEH